MRWREALGTNDVDGSHQESVQQSYVGAAALWMAFVPQVCQIAFEQLTIELLDVLDADRGQEPENRLIATTARAPPASKPSPLDNRSRTQRLGSSRSHGWVIRSNCRVRRPSKPRRASARHRAGIRLPSRRSRPDRRRPDAHRAAERARGCR